MMNQRELLPSVNRQRCSGCGRCVSACRSHLVTLDQFGTKKQAHFQGLENCNNCFNCFKECPLQAIVYY